MIEKMKKKGRGRPKGAPNKPKMELVTERVRLQKNADVYEILCQAEIVAAENEDFAVNGLKTFGESNGAVAPVCMWAFNDNIKSRLPEGPTPFKPNDAPDSDLSETSLRFEFKKFKYFCTDEVPDLRREAMWIQLMEGIPAKEAELMELVKDKTWPFKNITKEICQKAFPQSNF
jgi:hypothetical protein